MNCSDCISKIGSFIEGTLSIGEKQQMEIHFSTCDACKHMHDELIQDFAILESEKSTAHNPFIATRVMAAITEIEKPTARQIGYKKILQPLFIAASIVFAIAGGIKVGTLYSNIATLQIETDNLSFLDDAKLESLQTFEQD